MATAARARGRTVRAAVAAAIRAARTADRLQPWHEPSAAMATKVAKAMDAADLPVPELVRLSDQLQKLLDRLPLAPKGADGDGSDPPAGRTGQGEPHTAGLASGVGAGASVGDTALPA